MLRTIYHKYRILQVQQIKSMSTQVYSKPLLPITTILHTKHFPEASIKLHYPQQSLLSIDSSIIHPVTVSTAKLDPNSKIWRLLTHHHSQDCQGQQHNRRLHKPTKTTNFIWYLYTSNTNRSLLLLALQSSLMLRLRMRHRVLVAESALSSKRSLVKGRSKRSLLGEEGADLATRRISIPGEEEPGRSRDTVLFGRTENLGIGKELGGGEFEQVGPAHNSESKTPPPLGTSSLSSFLQALPLMGIGVLLGVTFTFPTILLSELGGVLGEP